ncbi:hypothetical protein MIND_00404800 [Mycena indigotica]|uniref:F-box domain-containing protein n=1 Tax=Mycena indigotica TaxID=2126181 RepID=A0A8H6WA25_9AGAR|nr:uncharacterized protein MIND_00404800 [Mycena indigotica]KAF7310307.1 hypothetical protein MIND_00404800 [Mycena indigotica]
MGDRIPPELIHLIVDHVKDRESLRACSLVALIFRAPCQQRLWTTMALRVQHDAAIVEPLQYPHSISTAKSTLEACPHLASYITCLKLTIVPETTDFAAVGLASTIKLLPNLTKVSLYPLNEVETSWTDIPDALRSVTESLLEMPTLRQVELAFFFAVPRQLLGRIFAESRCVYLRGIYLEHHKNASEQPSSPSSLERFKTRTIDIGYYFLPLPFLQPYFCSLRALVLISHRELAIKFVSVLQPLLQVAATSPSLEYLSIELPDYGKNPHGNRRRLQLPPFKRLQYLQVVYEYDSIDSLHEPPALLLPILHIAESAPVRELCLCSDVCHTDDQPPQRTRAATDLDSFLARFLESGERQARGISRHARSIAAASVPIGTTGGQFLL